MKKTRLLIVDDDGMFCSMVAHHFSKRYEVTKAHSFSEGLEAAKLGGFELVFLDQQLPDGKGMELCPKIIEYNENAKIIFVTGYPDVAQVVEAIKLGAYDYLCKPFEIQELELRAESALRTAELERIESFQRFQSKNERTNALGNQIIGLDSLSSLITLAASTQANLLVTGETGTGKNVVAKAIHYMSRVCNGPLVNFNCAAVPEGLAESELFGHERGAFTSAEGRRAGMFELADGGTLFLDEIGDMPLALQPKLLGVLDDGVVRRLGGSTDTVVDARVIAATNVDLEKAVREKRFRSDLFHRLNVLVINISPLRERPGDIQKLAVHFLRTLSKNPEADLASDQLEALYKYSWPGNVRELRNVAERAVLLQPGPNYSLEQILSTTTSFSPPPLVTAPGIDDDAIQSLEQMNQEYIKRALEKFDFNLTQTARVLGISLSTLKRKVKSYNFYRPL